MRGVIVRSTMMSPGLTLCCENAFAPIIPNNVIAIIRRFVLEIDACVFMTVPYVLTL
ncbi:hypothetical protein X949_1378 [Burkholderia pseudomallei MSHR5609]|nr:hypothetical protein DP44_4459 [Burkholderia pseudomallei]KGD54622.1 hypothetical protein DP49_1376 [Burkholderia pseudomallei]KGS54132.1 hypothetical protein X949_1378 [Burkholderia pseudomallei MSHR5609]